MTNEQRIRESAQWDAFNRVLSWINVQEEKMISKGDLYDAAMEMRPDTFLLTLGCESDIVDL